MTASQRLSSGFRINSAADDAAGLAITESMRAQIRGLDKSWRNAQDGIALIQTAEGGIATINEMVVRIRELVVQAANDTNLHDITNLNGSNRVMIQQEIDQLIREIDQVTRRLEFNSMRLLDGSLASAGSSSGGGAAGGANWNFIGDVPTIAMPLPPPATFSFGVPPTGVPAGWSIAFYGPGIGIPQINITHELSGINATANINTGNWMAIAGPWPVPSAPTGFANNQAPSAAIADYLAPFGWTFNQGGSGVWSFTMPGMAFFQNVPVPMIPQDMFVGTPATPLPSGFTGNQAANTVTHNESGVVFSIVNGAWVGSVPASPPGGAENNYWEQLATTTPTPPTTREARGLWLQLGANSSQGVTVFIESVDSYALGLRNFAGVRYVDVQLESGIDISPLIDILDDALSIVTKQRANLGAMQNRLEHTSRSLSISSENLSDSKSRIKDADMAREMMKFTMANVLQQSAISTLAQANQLPNTILQLFR